MTQNKSLKQHAYTTFFCLAITSVLITIGAKHAVANDVIVDGVNWSKAVITAEGWGIPPERYRNNPARATLMACRAAVVDVQRNLLERTKGVRVDSTTLVKDAMVESDLVRTAVSGLIRGVHPTKRTVLEDGSCKVDAELPISGNLFSAMVPRAKFKEMTQSASLQSHNDKSIFPQPESLIALVRTLLIPNAMAEVSPHLTIQSKEQQKLIESTLSMIQTDGGAIAAAHLQQALDDYQRISGFSGIIIDASEIPEFKLAALPWLRDSSGHKLYPNPSVSYDLVQKKLPVTYDFSIDDALKNARVATKPLVVKAVSTYQNRPSDLVLTGASLQRFLTVMDKNHLGEKARIMIIVSE